MDTALIDITAPTEEMRSATGITWRLRPAKERDILTLCQHYQLPHIVAHILVNRNIPVESVPVFMNPTIRELLPDPFHLHDMDKAAERIAHAIIQQEPIAVFGDYDVDGATSSALLKRFLRSVGSDARIYIPDRIHEGYGPNSTALLQLRKEGINVCITVDCGTVAYQPLTDAKAAGLDIIVIDHHLGQERLPDAIAVVNPNRIDETSPYRNLAAVGVSFLLAVAIHVTLRNKGWYQDHPEPDLLSLLDLVALGTVCDVMTLTGLNRAYVSQGLKILAKRTNLGLRTLSDQAGIDSFPSTYHLGFVLGPRINAGGRVGEAGLGARLLSTENGEEALHIAQSLHRFNEERKTIEDMVLTQAIEQASLQVADKPMLFIQGNGWHPGVIGIVAGRIKEQFNRPVAVIAIDQGIGKASVRSISGVDIGSVIAAAKHEGLLVAGGGHAMAAGFTVEEANIPALWDYVCNACQQAVAVHGSVRYLDLDCYTTIASIDANLVHTLETIGPYGPGHPEPRFVLDHVTLVACDIVGTNHIRCVLKDLRSANGPSLKAMAFRSVDQPLGHILLQSKGRPLKVAGRIRLNRWQGKETAELTIDDVS